MTASWQPYADKGASMRPSPDNPYDQVYADIAALEESLGEAYAYAESVPDSIAMEFIEELNGALDEVTSAYELPDWDG